jgi:hypothetical protein
MKGCRTFAQYETVASREADKRARADEARSARIRRARRQAEERQWFDTAWTEYVSQHR